MLTLHLSGSVIAEVIVLNYVPDYITSHCKCSIEDARSWYQFKFIHIRMGLDALTPLFARFTLFTIFPFHWYWLLLLLWLSVVPFEYLKHERAFLSYHCSMCPSFHILKWDVCSNLWGGWSHDWLAHVLWSFITLASSRDFCGTNTGNLKNGPSVVKLQAFLPLRESAK